MLKQKFHVERRTETVTKAQRELPPQEKEEIHVQFKEWKSSKEIDGEGKSLADLLSTPEKIG